jgi:hypothetical protein
MLRVWFLRKVFRGLGTFIGLLLKRKQINYGTPEKPDRPFISKGLMRHYF